MDLSGTSRNSVAKPPPVRSGDRIGIAALSGPVDPEALDRGVEALWELGFEPVLASNLAYRKGFFAGSDDERLAGFHDLIADDDLGGVIFARGGHGILRLLPHLDWALMARRPRAYVGYSDLTPLLNLLVSRLGQVALHGPMVAVDFARGLTTAETDSLLAALAGEQLPPLALLGEWTGTEGVLMGGCLSLLNAMVGTSFQVSAADSVLFWEDVGEPLYRLDRMLTQLGLSGSLTGIRGMVVAKFELHEDDVDSGLLPELLQEWSLEIGCPLAHGIESGHCAPNLTLPLGVKVRMDAHRRELVFLE